MATRCPLGLWLKISEPERTAYIAAHPDFYIDASDLTGAPFAPGFGPDPNARARADSDDDQFDHARYREELGMTERDYSDWTRGT